MHATKAMASAMTTAEMYTTEMSTSAEMATTSEMSATAVATSAVTTAVFRQRCTRQQGRNNQNGNLNAGLRHLSAPA
jgi:hypothetical protein